MIKLLKRREIFVILNKLCVFFNPYISSHTFKVGICVNRGNRAQPLNGF